LSSESFDRTTPTPVLLVGVDFGFPHFDGELEELGLLAGTAGLRPVARLTCKRKVPDAALFVGSGKADEIRMLAQMHGAQEPTWNARWAASGAVAALAKSRSNWTAA
jgi:GTP-binding protein HflX